jgi:hypothetical protein
VRVTELPNAELRLRALLVGALWTVKLLDAVTLTVIRLLMEFQFSKSLAMLLAAMLVGGVCRR